MLPTYRRPSCSVIAAHDCTSPGRPNAHFSLSRGTSAAVMPAAAAGWNRVFDGFCPNPLQRAAFAAGALAGAAPVHIADGAGAIENGAPNDLPLTNSASARRSAVVRPWVIDTIEPNSSASSTSCGVMARKMSSDGARSVAVLWQLAQCSL